jgi:hypothetical protein
MSLPAQTFTGVTQAAFDRMAAEVQKDFGIAITGPNGQASASGFMLSWNYDAVGKVLVLQCLKKPWIVPVGTVQSRIAKMVQQEESAV